jgi:hypothetical protein
MATIKRIWIPSSILGKLCWLAYWLTLLALLLFFPVLQACDAMPEGSVWRILKIALLVGVPFAAVATVRWRRLHAVTVLTLLASGTILFALNQGFIHERAGQSDLRVLQRTKQLLVDKQSWNRSPSRDCAVQSQPLTLYCAAREASIEVTGGFRHRRPALQILRSEIKVLWPNKEYEHGIADFNADPDISFSDLQRLLDASIARVASEVSHGS